MKLVSLSFTLLAAWILFCGVLCEPFGGPDPNFKFQAALHIFPERASYKVGDTIRLELKIANNKLLDIWSGDSILLENSALPLNLVVSEHLFKAPFDSTLATFFIEETPEASFTESNFENLHMLQMGYGCGQDTIHFRLGICFKKAGIFNIGFKAFETLTFNFGSSFDCLTGVGTSDLAFLDYLFEVDNANQEIYEKVKTPPDPHTFVSGAVSMETLIFSKRTYWFEVIE